MRKDAVRALLIYLGIPLAVAAATGATLWYHMTQVNAYITATIAQITGTPTAVVDVDDTTVTIKQTLTTPPVNRSTNFHVTNRPTEKRVEYRPVTKVSPSKLRILCNQAVYKGTARCSK